MSWFVGIAGHNQSLKEEIKTLADTVPLLEIESESLYLVGGGLESTIHYSHNSEKQKGWLASGIGISLGDNPRLMKSNDWEKGVSQGREFLHQLNGHFAVIHWDGDQLECTTDQLGMRNIFLHEGEGFTVFSTRLDWLMKLIPKATINWERFGSRWLAINQFSSQSFMDGIERLSQGGHAVVKSGEVEEITNQRWNCEFAESEPDAFK